MAEELLRTAEHSPTLSSLAGASSPEFARALVGELADGEPDERLDRIRSKWLWLVLSWYYESEATIRDRLGLVEIAYAAFGYPEEVAEFVRYMPKPEWPDLGTREANEARLLDRWREYLDMGTALYGRPQSSDQDRTL
jgi:hypothetical protein